MLGRLSSLRSSWPLRAAGRPLECNFGPGPDPEDLGPLTYARPAAAFQRLALLLAGEPLPEPELPLTPTADWLVSLAEPLLDGYGRRGEVAPGLSARARVAARAFAA